MSRQTMERDAIAFSQATEAEAQAAADLATVGIVADVDGHAVGRVGTSHAFRMSEWDYVTEADLAAAVRDYSERLASVQADIAAGRIDGARARRALRIAEHAVKVAERQSLETNYAEDEATFDPSIVEAVDTGRFDLLPRPKAADGSDRYEYRPFVPPTAEQVILTSRNPMGAASWSLALEHAATQYLHAHGVKTTARPDVWSRRHGTHLAMADRVAYKGVVRYADPAPCRVGALGSEPAELGNVERRVTELLVTPRRHVVAGQWVPNNGPVRTAWRGHRKIQVRLATRRAAATERKATAKRALDVKTLKVGKRGPAVDPWNLASRSLLAAIKRDERTAATAATIESVMRTGRFGSSLTFSDGTIATLSDVSLSTVVYRDVAMPVRELARRAALAGLDLD